MNKKWREPEERWEQYLHVSEDIDRWLVDRTREVIGCAMEVLNVLGHGLLEKPYEQALVVEFGLRGIPYRQQAGVDVLYKGQAVGYFVPDLIVYESIVIDTKTVERIGSQETGQMLNYLRITGLELGLLLNFSKPRLEWRRVAL